MTIDSNNTTIEGPRSLIAGQVVLFTLRFSEAVRDITPAAIDLGNAHGTLGNVHGTPGGLTPDADRKVWNAWFTPTANVSDATNTITIDLTKVLDAQGQPGRGSVVSANYPVDTLRPVLHSATVNGNQVVLSYTEETALDDFNMPDAQSFKVAADGTALGVNFVEMDAAHNTITLTLATPVTDSQTVTVGYHDFMGNDSAVHDLAGNRAAEVSPGIVATHSPPAAPVPDDIAPTLLSSSIDLPGTETGITLGANATAFLTFTFSEAVKDFDAQDVTLPPGSGTLENPRVAHNATSGRIWTALLTAPASPVTRLAINPSVDLGGLTDLAGNAGQATAQAGNAGQGTVQATDIHYNIDTKPPEFASATVNGDQLVLSYTEGMALNTSRHASNGAFTVRVDDSTAKPVTGVTVDAAAKTVTLTLDGAVLHNQSVTVAYQDNHSNHSSIEDTAGNYARSFAATPVANTTPPDTQPPTLLSARIDMESAESPPVLRSGANAAVTFVFSEAVKGFDTGDIHLPAAYGELFELIPINTIIPGASDTWRATLKAPTAEATLPASSPIALDLGGLTDRAGNLGQGTVPLADIRYSIDTALPVLASATVSGNQLVLGYTEATTLNASHHAPAAAFTVTADGAPNAVTDVSVDAQAKTVTLTLTHPVTDNQAVSLAYNAPTTGNDATQDAAGNHAASIPVRPVDHPMPAPAAPPEPPVADTDKDGLSNTIEDQTPGLPRPGGAAPVAGDGNGDGIKDSTQADVGSTSLARSPSGASHPAGVPTTRVTLVVGSHDGKPGADSSAGISNLAQQDAPARLPQGMQMPIGLLHFAATLGADGNANQSLSLYVDPALGVNGSWAQDKTSGVWVNLASEPYGGKMVTEGGRLRLDFHVVDGGPFDADGKADGVITVPGAPAHMPLSIVGQAPDAGQDGFWF